MLTIRKLLRTAPLSIAALVAAVPGATAIVLTSEAQTDSAGLNIIVVDGDTLNTSFISPPDTIHSGPLTAADYAAIAEELGVEAATIRAVVDVETGKTQTGFFNDSLPLINFDLSVFRRMASRRKVDLTRAAAANSEALTSPNVRKYGSQQAAQHARLNAAMAIDTLTAVESTFWGMFQIGGFNWKLCGCSSPTEFVELMSRSEYDQLHLFANFIRNAGLLTYLKNKNWAAFARKYNGPSYASRGYHTKLASAYNRYKNQT